ncbi:ABC transporter substrate-binding protein [Rhodococcoides kyotonense]|uniref:Peptide/nickel transport system substrate-binding protein n=1 Tax=Rhodococcoides kyotonense TaxID=398843 RepID=A0A239N6M6_9NOCA|nr:ABC transporter substrate-binding protein [Rhodococcus kyotonensis]SNT49838.1 peptide/nickel transport system substrate-binding protein [Rhodococcus kyotonensis]
MNFGPKLRAATALAASVLVLAGCGGNAESASSDESSTPRSGGSITVGIIPACGLDKAQTSGCNFANVEVVDNLTEQLPDTGEVVPWLAESWDIADDGKSYTFHLKDGVTFSNGETLDAAAVKLNFDNVVELGKQGRAFQSSAYLQGYRESVVVDPLTLRVDFDIAKAGFLQALSEKPLGIIAPETITTKTPEDRLAFGVIGSGPFVIDEVVPDQKIVVSRRDDYEWSSPKNDHTGPAYLDQVTFQILPEDLVRTGALLSGQIQVSTTIPSNDVDSIRGQGFDIVSRSSAGVVYTYYPNVTDPILSDEAVRKALQLSLDRQEIHDTVFNEFQTVPSSILSTTHPNYTDLSDDLSQNQDEARRILDDAGWREGSDGVREKDGRKLSVAIQFSANGDKPIHELAQQQLRAVGIDFQLQQITAAEALANRNSGQWQLQYGNLTRPDADVLVSAFDPTYSNYFKASYDPELEGLLDTQASELDDTKRGELADRIQQIIVERGYAFPVTEGSQTQAAPPTVHGLSFQAPWWPSFVDAWIEE